MRVLVTGGRTYGELPSETPATKETIALTEKAMQERRFLYETLQSIHDEYGIVKLAQGGANGADRIAQLWCAKLGIECETFPAQWSVHGRSAGPIRNTQMFAQFKPDLVVAFPGNRGTAHMIHTAQRGNCPVRIVTV